MNFDAVTASVRTHDIPECVVLTCRRNGYGRFLEPESRKAFFEAYKDIEALWEILSPSAELRDHVESFKRLAQLYAAVRNAYADKVGFVADLAYKTKRLVEESATQNGLGKPTRGVRLRVLGKSPSAAAAQAPVPKQPAHTSTAKDAAPWPDEPGDPGSSDDFVGF
jgi:hypothetical protein